MKPISVLVNKDRRLRNKTAIMVFFIIIFILPNYISANETTMGVEVYPNPVYNLGEVIQFEYLFLSNFDTNLSYFVGVKCEEEILSFHLYKIVNLKSNIPLSDKFEGSFIHSSIESQTCAAYVKILSPTKQIISKNFSIITDSSFLFNIKLDKKIFLKNEDIYLDYSSDVENLEITAELTYPNKRKEDIDLPTSIKSSQIGTYELEVEASKEGYKKITKKEQFGVIEKHAKIRKNDETEMGELGEIKNNNLYVLIGALILIVLIILFYFIKRR